MKGMTVLLEIRHHHNDDNDVDDGNQAIIEI